jgi:hypothetical protein
MGFSPCGTFLGVIAFHLRFFRSLISRTDKVCTIDGLYTRGKVCLEKTTWADLS